MGSCDHPAPLVRADELTNRAGRHPRRRPISGAETHLVLVKRATTALRRIGARFADRNVTVVSHGAFINAVNGHAMHWSGTQPEPAINGSIHDIAFKDGQLPLRYRSCTRRAPTAFCSDAEPAATPETR